MIKRNRVCQFCCLSDQRSLVCQFCCLSDQRNRVCQFCCLSDQRSLECVSFVAWVTMQCVSFVAFVSWVTKEIQCVSFVAGVWLWDTQYAWLRRTWCVGFVACRVNLTPGKTWIWRQTLCLLAPGLWISCRPSAASLKPTASSSSRQLFPLFYP